MKHLAISAPGREDVQDIYRRFLKLNWPDCWEPEFLDSPSDTGWTKRLLTWLRAYQEPILLMNLDDYVCSRPVRPFTIDAVLKTILQNENIGTIQLYKVKEPELLYSGLAGFGMFSKDGALEKRSQILPAFHRRDFLIKICENVLSRITPEQDKAWAGAYNFELYGGEPSRAMDVLTPLANHENAPVQIVNMVEQGKWTEHGLHTCRISGVPIAPAQRGIHHVKDNPYIEAWDKARP